MSFPNENLRVENILLTQCSFHHIKKEEKVTTLIPVLRSTQT